MLIANPIGSPSPSPSTTTSPVALWTDRKAAKRLDEEHKRSDRQLKEERALELHREQFAEANAVQVLYAADVPTSLDVRTIALDVSRVTGGGQDSVLVMVNHGRYTITGIDALWVFRGGRTKKFAEWERLSRMGDLDPRLLAGVEVLTDVHQLSPWDLGLRINSGPMADMPIVRWTDRWGTRWEHRRGGVRLVRDDESWSPSHLQALPSRRLPTSATPDQRSVAAPPGSSRRDAVTGETAEARPEYLVGVRPALLVMLAPNASRRCPRR
jgi:hypothetical protein